MMPIVGLILMLQIPERCSEYAEHVNKYAGNIPPNLIMAIMYYESGCNPEVTGRYGEAGLMQILPLNFERLAITQPYDPEQNIRGGARYLNQLYTLTEEHGIPERERLRYTVAGYNAGERVIINRRIQNWEYVRGVLHYYCSFPNDPLFSEVCGEIEPPPSIEPPFPDVCLEIHQLSLIREAPSPLRRGENIEIKTSVVSVGRDSNRVRVAWVIYSFPDEFFEVQGSRRSIHNWNVARVRTELNENNRGMATLLVRVKKNINERVNFKVRVEMNLARGERRYLPTENQPEKVISFPSRGFFDPEGHHAVTFTYHPSTYTFVRDLENTCNY